MFQSPSNVTAATIRIPRPTIRAECNKRLCFAIFPEYIPSMESVMILSTTDVSSL